MLCFHRLMEQGDLRSLAASEPSKAVAPTLFLKASDDHEETHKAAHEVQAEGSGHSKWRKARFAGTLSSIYVGQAVASPAKDFYLEKLGADPVTTGILFIVVSFIVPLGEMLSGRLQNKEALARCFPVAKWGRKAPWLTTHVLVMAAACGIMYIPPTSSKLLLGAWFLVVSVVINFGVSTMTIAFESCRQEIYPYMEERAQVEGLCKIACAVGVGYSALPLLVVLAFADFYLRLGASVLFVIGALAFGFQSFNVWLEAKSPTIQESDSFFQDFVMSWRNAAFRQVALVRVWEGVSQGLQNTNVYYYTTYIMQLGGIERSAWVVVIGITNMAADIVIGLLMTRFINKRANVFKLQTIALVMRAFDMVVCVVVLGFPIVVVGAGPHPIGGSALWVERLAFLAWIFFSRLCQSPFSFWRVGAQCWVIDEDIQNGDGARREAAFIGVASATSNFARAFAASVAFFCYTIAGLAPRDCAAECLSNNTLQCQNDCFNLSIISQPQAFRWYTRMLSIVGLTVCDLMMCIHTGLFPIKGIRLARLYQKQTVARGGEMADGSPQEQMRKLATATTMQAVAKALPGESKVVMGLDDPSAGVKHVCQFQKRGKALSASVVFSPALEAIRDSAGIAQADSWKIAKEHEGVRPPTPFVRKHSSKYLEPQPVISVEQAEIQLPKE